MSDIDVVVRDTLRSLASITILAKEVDESLDYDLYESAEGVNYMKAMVTGILAITRSQRINLETVLGDE